MSSFQFPANPSDGDIVVRGNLQAFYNAATNTWRVSEIPTAPGIPGPPGPPGPIGPPGQGVQISGAVATAADLPAPNAAQFEFWIVDDTNELYWSDGLTWTNFGGPIQGPQGIEGPAGADGTNGQNGRGWYDTSIDESNGEYKVTFLSNDGLTFTTDNLKGPPGNDGEDGNDGQDFTGNFPCATTDTIGAIRLGQGLSKDTACVVSVDLEDVPVESDPVTGTPLGAAVFYAPIQINLGERKDFRAISNSQNNTTWSSGSTTVTMPSGADGAILFYFASTSMKANAQSTNANFRNFRAYVIHKLRLTGATYTDGFAEIMRHSHFHNLTIRNDQQTEKESILPLTKVNDIQFDTGAQVTFSYNLDIEKAGQTYLKGGDCRIVVYPYRRSDSPIVDGRGVYTGPVEYGDVAFYNEEDAAEIERPPVTEEDMKIEAASDAKQGIEIYFNRINAYLDYATEQERVQLLDLRDQLFAVRNLSGSYEDIGDHLVDLAAQIDNIVHFRFPFE
jgi:hypothetical protein